MIQYQEYEIMPKVSEYEELDKLYSNFNLNLKAGWNLVSNPIEDDINVSSKIQNLEKLYKYSQGIWSDDNYTLTQNEGVWLQLNTDESIELKGDSYPLAIEQNSTTWNLIGIGEDILEINSTELNSSDVIWIYNSKEWIKNPSKIYRGYGAWVK
jgi:hypothetical protein